MTVKKLLPLILMAVGAVFLLSSCDAILDALYANNTITVSNTYVPTAYYGSTNPNSYVSISLGGATGGSQNAGYTGTAISGLAYYNGVSFNKLPNGNYTVTASFYGYYLGQYFQYGPVTFSLSLPYNGSNVASFYITF